MLRRVGIRGSSGGDDSAFQVHVPKLDRNLASSCSCAASVATQFAQLLGLHYEHPGQFKAGQPYVLFELLQVAECCA